MNQETDKADRCWRPIATLDAIRLRAEVLRDLREFFFKEGLIEVQTPVLSRDTVIDRHINPICVPGESLAIESVRDSMFFLQTSPEFAMKRLVAAGIPALYQIGPVFRAGEMGSQHNPEFTMVEWYRVGDDFQAGIDLLKTLVLAVVQAAQVDVATYQEMFQQYAACDPLTASVVELARCAEARLDVDLNWSQDRDDWLNLMFSEMVQPMLGASAPLILVNYPASQSALAKVSREDPRVAERFELFIHGVELANGYHELVNAEELEARNEKVNAQRVSDGNQQLPADSRMLEAMKSGLPHCSGCALGLDRLLMVLAQADRLEQVQPFPITRA